MSTTYEEKFKVVSTLYGTATVTVEAKISRNSCKLTFSTKPVVDKPGQKLMLLRLTATHTGTDLVITNQRTQLRNLLKQALKGSVFSVDD